jgi:hypothetical protein
MVRGFATDNVQATRYRYRAPLTNP